MVNYQTLLSFDNTQNVADVLQKALKANAEFAEVYGLIICTFFIV